MKTIFKLNPRDCRYLTGKFFCGAPTVHGNSSWCKEHHDVVFQRSSNNRAPMPISLPIDKIEVKDAKVDVLELPDLTETMK